MFKTIINAWKVKDIRTKMLYTLLLIVVYRLGSFIPVPSVNGEKLGELIASYDFLSFLNLFSGGSLNNFSLFAMGISPYITASIILQLLTIAFPSLEKLSKEEDGREKIEKITRIVGVVLALIQSVSIVVGLNSANGDSHQKDHHLRHKRLRHIHERLYALCYHGHLLHRRYCVPDVDG